MNRSLVDSDGECPHCLRHVNFKAATDTVGGGPVDAEVLVMDDTQPLALWIAKCPSCRRTVIQYVTRKVASRSGAYGTFVEYGAPHLLWPKSRTVPSLSPHAPEHIRQDLKEAHLTLDVSVKASAALSRRAMQAILHDQGIKKRNLDEEIEAAIPTLPAYINESLLHGVRRIGNFCAHAKEDNTGAIMDASEEEAEWLLMVLEQLIDHYYVRPALNAQRLAALNAKDPNTDPSKRRK